MLDIKLIREHPNQVQEALRKRGIDFDPAELLAADAQRRAAIKNVEELRALHRRASDEIRQLSLSERPARRAAARQHHAQLATRERELTAHEELFTQLMYQLPNIPLEEVPIGKDERSNVVLREVGEKPHFSFPPSDYMDIAGRLDLIDTTRAAKISGSRFGYLKRDAALLEFALIQFTLEKLMRHQFIPVVPPALVREDAMRGMGYIDSAKDRAERYFLPEDKLYLVGTAEQSLAPMHADETLPARALPLRYAGFSTCFRREAGSYGKDTHGILRVHQFDKVEMVIFALPEQSRAEHELMIRLEEELMQELGLPYRVVALSTGDLAQPSAATFDIEAWLPGQNKGQGVYRETHSSSNTTDFQARRLAIKVRRANAASEFAHILNGTGFAVGRTLIAILENYQQKDGSVRIPDALQPYLRNRNLISSIRDTQRNVKSVE